LIYRSGTTPNDYLYCGEQFDANLGFYYLRARYMNSSSGRFWTSDSYEGDRVDPGSLHKYLHGNGDPVNRIDPSGHFSLGEAVQVATISTILANISIISFSFASAAMHNFDVDGALISLRGNYNTHGFTGGLGIDVIFQFSTRQWFYAGTGELGTNPLSLFGKHRGFGLQRINRGYCRNARSIRNVWSCGDSRYPAISRSFVGWHTVGGEHGLGSNDSACQTSP
jgi:RHS repeat-associated protein